MDDKILDFESRKEAHLLRRKEAKVEEMREAFRLARGEKSGKQNKQRKRRKNPKKK